MTDKRYQVFVSSTFSDLQEERREIMQALLELDCIPAGMELFPAASDDQWTLIKRIIDNSDYYLVVIGGRYGSCDSEGISFTEREYRYALKKDIPIIGFIHATPEKIPAEHSESDPTKKEKLKDFIDLIRNKHIKTWMNASDLGSKVSRSIVILFKTHPAIGWIKANQLADDAANKEILRLRNRIEDLEKQSSESEHRPPAGASDLAQGEELCNFRAEANFSTSESPGSVFAITFDPVMEWNEIFKSLSLFISDEISESRLYAQFSKILEEYGRDQAKRAITKALKNEKSGRNLTEVTKITCDLRSFKNILVQLRALGLIDTGQKKRELSDRATYWALTRYGEYLKTQLNAVRSGSKVVI